jgi:hypothetical protein
MPHIVEMQFHPISQQHQHDSGACMIASESQLKFYINHMPSAISIKLHGFVFGNRPADVPQDIPKISAPGISNAEV